MSAADRAAFLAAIRDNPEDDLPRLIYADWLEEHGEPQRAEFIRVQCELARLPRRDARRTELERRARELLECYEDAWRADLPVTYSTPHHRVTRASEYRPVPAIVYGPFERGFVGTLRVERFTVFETIVERVFAATPIHRLEAHVLSKPTLRDLFRMPVLSNLTELNLSAGQVGNTGVETLVRSPHLIRLNTLKLNSAVIGDAGAQALAESPRARGFTWLELAGNRIEDTGAEVLAASPYLTGLKTLDVRRNRLSAAARAVLRARFRSVVKL
jgi:uncharacterized protein (TIGR02996 family)